jgi:ankyrin repeat protein
MHRAAEKGKHLRLRPFLSGNVNATDDKGLTALDLAAGNGHLRCITMLLDTKADVNSTISLGRGPTPLMLAAESGHLDVVNALIEANADVNIVVGGTTALFWACRCPTGHSIVAALLAAGALVDAPDATRSPLSIHHLKMTMEHGHLQGNCISLCYK